MSGNIYQTVVNQFGKFMSSLTWKKSTLVVVILVLFLIVLFVLEQYTGYLRLHRIERSIEVLERLAHVDQDVVGGDRSSLAPLYDSIRGDLARFVERDAQAAESQNDNSELDESVLRSLARNHPVLFKAGFALVPWILAFMFTFLGTGSRNNWLSVLGGVCLAAMIPVAIASVLPVFKLLWLNYIVVPFVLFAVFMSIILSWSTSKRDP